jgi:protein MpaA
VVADTRVNANKVDLNRNWPTQNWRENTETPGSPYFGGPVAASEPETRALMGLMDQLQPRVIVSIHSPYRVVNFDGPQPQTLQLAEAMAARNGYPVTASIGYPTPGSFGNWAGVERQIPTITLELPDLNNSDAALRPDGLGASQDNHTTIKYPDTLDALDERVWQENRDALWAVVY